MVDNELPNIFPIFRKQAPLIEKLKELRAQKGGQTEKEVQGEKIGVDPGELTDAQKRLAEEFKAGIAEALQVPPEAIRLEPVEKWVIEWSKAWVSPEYWAEVVTSISASKARSFGMDLGEMIASLIADAPDE